LIASLKFAGRLRPGAVKLDTPVGAVDVELKPDGRISVANVVSYRSERQVIVNVPGIGAVAGDIAWGGNWFFLISHHDRTLDLEHVESLTDYSWRVREALNAQGHPLVDHVELFGPSVLPGAQSRNFVLCPGKAYDRSPCGTGTSAKLSCLAADGKLLEGDVWVQESLIGSTFEATYRWHDRSKGEIVPVITGTAYVTGENLLHLDAEDPFRWGIRA
jgi:4-hydroxyproline epimerase